MTALRFPSPYGVSFILIWFQKSYKNKLLLRFPSPCGVSFILMLKTIGNKGFFNIFPSPYGVIFILTLEYEKDDGLF